MTSQSTGRPRVLLWAIIAACLGSCLVASLVVLLPPAMEWWGAKRATSYQHILRQGFPSGSALAAAGVAVDEEDFVAFLKGTAPSSNDPYGDPWLFAALVIGYLRLYNVPLWDPAVAALYSPRTRDTAIPQAADTWATLAGSHLGSRDLWPLLILLNRDWITKRGVALAPGWRIKVAEAGNLDLADNGGI